jgi:hypothetical protein
MLVEFGAVVDAVCRCGAVPDGVVSLKRTY